MDEQPGFSVKDIKLAEKGRINIQLAEQKMQAIMGIRDRFTAEKPFKGVRIGMALHVTKDTAVLVRTLIAGGAEVAITGCNPLSTQDDVAAALAKEGVHVYAYKGESKEDYYKFIDEVLKIKPQIVIDDGCDLILRIHQHHPALIKDMLGGCEETTTGVNRLRAMHKAGELKFPVIAVNDNKTKHLLDNYYGTGQSTIDGIFRATGNMLIAGKNFVVAGYGSCGKGVSMRARGMGANVIIVEVDPFAALQAVYDGYRVMPMSEAAKIGDIFVTVTGNRDIITLDHIRSMKNGAVLANSGHFNVEVDVEALDRTYKKKKMRDSLEEYDIDGKIIHLCGEGRLINLVAAEGHPSEVMATSFMGQALACEYLVKQRGKLTATMITLPKEIDNQIAVLQLAALGVNIDSMTARQQKYFESWEDGT